MRNDNWLRRESGFEALDNGVLRCDDPKRLQAICDGLSAEKIDALSRKWLRLLPHPYSVGDRRAGYRYQISILQAEFSLTQVLDLSSRMINWVYFPKSSPPPEFGLLIVALFEEMADAIDSGTRSDQHSDTVMARLRPGLEKLGFLVEKGKSSENKIVVPVLFGRKGKILKCFNADAHAASKGWVLEVEAGRAVDNNQFLKDIFQACMMHDVLHLAIAVRNTYRNSDDFAKVENFLETLYVSGRLQLPLKGILLIGY